MSMITSLAWIPRGAARQRPIRFELNAEEYERVKLLAKQELMAKKDAGEAVEEEGDEDDGHQESDIEVDTSDLPPELDMDNYDEDDESEEGEDGGEVLFMHENDQCNLILQTE